VTNTLDDLAADIGAIPVRAQAALPRVVHKNLTKGNRIAQRLAREKAGPHGKNYWKRLSAEMTGPLSGEYGPEGEPKSDFIGVGFRHGVNLDLPNSADQIAPKFAGDVLDAADGLFW
jgi:hypothetical protein